MGETEPTRRHFNDPTTRKFFRKNMSKNWAQHGGQIGLTAACHKALDTLGTGAYHGASDTFRGAPVLEVVLWLIMTHPTEDWRRIEIARGTAHTFTLAECSEAAWAVRSLSRTELVIPGDWGHTAICDVEQAP